MTESQPDTALDQLRDELSPSEALTSMQQEVVTEFDSSQIDVQKFIIDGKVDLESVERFKSVISANDLEILNQLKPGILFDLFVEGNGEQFTINFGTNTDADAHIGLSQILRGHSNKYEGGATPLEAIRVLLVHETEGEVHEATRDGLGGNFYEASSAYQEVHNGYIIEITQENEQVALQLEELKKEAHKETRRLALSHSRFMRLDQDTAPEMAHFEHKERRERYKYKRQPDRQNFLEYMYIESRMQGVDPELMMAIVDASFPSGSVDFENNLQWTIRAIKAHEKNYESFTTKKSHDANGHYTAEFITYLIQTGDEMMEYVNRDRFQEMYGKVSDQKFEWAKAEAIQPLLSLPRDLEAPERRRMMDGLVGGTSKRMSSNYGERWDPIAKRDGRWERKTHHGIDIGAPLGAPIYAADRGIVLKAEFQGGENGGGWYVRIQHTYPDGQTYITQYLHAKQILKGIVPGAEVAKGQQIAEVGNTGRSTGSHLHFEVYSLANPSKGDSRSNRVYSNPWSYLDQVSNPD